MRKNKGISMIALIITIVVMVIIAGIVIYMGSLENVDNATFTSQYTEMCEVSDAVEQRAIMHTLNSEMYAYSGTALSNASPEEIGGEAYGDGYYKLETDEAKAALGLENVKGNYIINYETGETIAYQAITYEEGEYHKLSDLAEIMNGAQSTTVAEYDDSQKVNKPYVCAGMVPVKYNGSNWVVTTTSDSAWYNYTNGKWANIMLIDNIVTSGHTNAQIRTMTTYESLAGETVTTEGSMFVWIPRYTFKKVGGENKVVYSKLLNDYTKDGYTKHPAFYLGEYTGNLDANEGYKVGGKELSGIWISKYAAGK